MGGYKYSVETAIAKKGTKKGGRFLGLGVPSVTGPLLNGDAMHAVRASGEPAADSLAHICRGCSTSLLRRDEWNKLSKNRPSKQTVCVSCSMQGNS